MITRVLMKKLRAGRMQMAESKYKYEIQNFLSLINDDISFTTLASLLLHLEI